MFVELLEDGQYSAVAGAFVPPFLPVCISLWGMWVHHRAGG